MRGSSARWLGAVIALSLVVPVGVAEGHPADWMYQPGAVAKQIGGRLAGGAAMFMQREDPLPGSFTEIGHEPLMNRGMNAAIAVNGRYVYVGSRTDGKNNNANNAGVLIGDAIDPGHPKVVKQMGPPL